MFWRPSLSGEWGKATRFVNCEGEVGLSEKRTVASDGKSGRGKKMKDSYCLLEGAAGGKQ